MAPLLILAAVGGGVFVFDKWAHNWFIQSSPPGTKVPFGADSSGNTTVQLVPGHDLGTLTVASGQYGASVAAIAPAGGQVISYTSSNPAVFPESPIDPGQGVALGMARGPGTTTLVFSGDTGWRSSFTVTAS